MQQGKNPGTSFYEGSQWFRGSWSGYERDDYFHNPDGADPRFFQSSYIYGLDFDDDGRAGVPVDIDGDGDLDLALQSLQGLRLMENTSPARNFARVRLTATKTENLALNAVVKVISAGVAQQDYVRLTDGYASQVPRELHFGLADATGIDEIRVEWRSGDVQVLKGLPVNRLIEITEGQEKPVISELRKWPDEFRPKRKPQFSYDIVADRIEGGPGSLASKGKPVVINFWAPWCAGCVEELPELARIASANAGEFQFVGVSVETGKKEDVLKAIADFGLKYPQFYANEALLRSFFGDAGDAALPSTFVLDAQGKLRRVFRRALGSGELDGVLDSLKQEGTRKALYFRLAGEKVDAGRPDEAIPYLDKALEISPDDAEAWFHKGGCLFQTGKVEESVVALQKAIQYDPRHSKALYNLGVAMVRQKRTREGIDLYEQALKLEGENAGMLIALSVAAAELELWPKSNDAADRALKSNAEYAPAWLQKGKLLIVNKDYKAAREHLNKALALDSGLAEARQYLFELDRMGAK
ncbi:MAG: tetratricopeptide repeat protein [Planctomycetota bacterium]